jgi:hypothetical protein
MGSVTEVETEQQMRQEGPDQAAATSASTPGLAAPAPTHEVCKFQTCLLPLCPSLAFSQLTAQTVPVFSVDACNHGHFTSTSASPPWLKRD